jgi:hypothetical protein
VHQIFGGDVFNGVADVTQGQMSLTNRDADDKNNQQADNRGNRQKIFSAPQGSGDEN